MSDFSDRQHQHQQHYALHYEHEHQHSTSSGNIPSYNDTSHFYTSSNPGAINIAFGSAMMGSMLIFFLWMCYFCRCKDPKPDDENSTVSSINQPYPYWIDIPDDNDTEERITICDENEVYESFGSYHSNCIRERLPTPPPMYETLFKPPPTYEDAIKQTTSAPSSKKTANLQPEVYIIR